MSKKNSPVELLQKASRSFRYGENQDRKLTIEEINKKEIRLRTAKKNIKAKFAGLDKKIDEIFNYINFWYLFPEAQRKPITISLWGMTGVGKTSLVRALVKELNLQSSFVSEDLGQWTGATSFRHYGKKYRRLSGVPSIILLDELHTARSLDRKQADVGQGSLQEIWGLIDTGEIDLGIDEYIIMQDNLIYEQRQLREMQNTGMLPYVGNFDSHSYVENIVAHLELSLTTKSLIDLFHKDRENVLAWLINEYSWYNENVTKINLVKSVIFVAGNLDEAFTQFFLVNPDDVNAEDLHEKSREIGIDSIKSNLLSRLRPEQVARLGNLHIVFPSLSKQSFYKVIEIELESIADWAKKHTGVSLNFHPSVAEVIFKDGVIPVQGARSVLSTIRGKIDPKITSWLIQAVKSGVDNLLVNFSQKDQSFHVMNVQTGREFVCDYFALKEDNLPQVSISESYKRVLSVHEAGHAVVGIVTQGKLPIKILSGGISWHRGGPRVVFRDIEFLNATLISEQLQMLLGGRIAEKIILGEKCISNGSSHDLLQATELAAQAIQSCAMGDHLSISHKVFTRLANESFQDRDEVLIEEWLHSAAREAEDILRSQIDLLQGISEQLLTKERLTVHELGDLVKQYYKGSKSEIEKILIRTEPKSIEELSRLPEKVSA